METSFVYAPRCESLDHVPVETLLQMREDGMTNMQIAEKFGVSYAKISDILPHKYRRLNDEDKQGIFRAWNQGKTKTEIAIMFNCSESTVVDNLRRQGIDVPVKKKHWTTKEINRLERCLNLGMSYGECAIEFERSIESIRAAVKYYHLQKDHRKEHRIDGTPVPEEKKVLPMPEPEVEEAEPEQSATDIYRSPNAVRSLEIEEVHTKTIRGGYDTYVYNVDEDTLEIGAHCPRLLSKDGLVGYICELNAVLEAIS